MFFDHFVSTVISSAGDLLLFFVAHGTISIECCEHIWFPRGSWLHLPKYMSLNCENCGCEICLTRLRRSFVQILTLLSVTNIFVVFWGEREHVRKSSFIRTVTKRKGSKYKLICCWVKVPNIIHGGRPGSNESTGAQQPKISTPRPEHESLTRCLLFVRQRTKANRSHNLCKQIGRFLLSSRLAHNLVFL